MAPGSTTPRPEELPQDGKAQQLRDPERGRGTKPQSADCMWMDPAWNGTHRSRPRTASVQVRELSWQGLHNPCPQNKGLSSHGDSHREQMVRELLSPAQLQALAQVDDLQCVQMLELCVNTRENSLGNFGVHLPNLSQLKLNGSCLDSLRDLGTSLGHLQVLWLARCGLTDLDGIGSFPALKELYVSYNNISALSPLCLLEQLEVLDLEGNSVEDLGQVRYLQLCPRLATLTLEGNLVCQQPVPGPPNKVPGGYNYRAEVRKLIPQLRVLDEVPTMCTDLPASLKLNQDWLMVKDAIKEGSMLDSFLPLLDRSHGATMQKLDPALTLPETQPWALPFLGPEGPLPEGLLPKDSAPEDHASNLTHGAGQVLCGNPTKGLRERRYQCQDGQKRWSWEPKVNGASQRYSAKGRGCCSPFSSRQPESQQEGATALQDPRRAPEQQEKQAGHKTSPELQGSASEPSRTLCCHLIPSPPKDPVPSDSASIFPQGSANLLFKGRKLRALGILGPGLGEGFATMTAQRALEVALGSTLEPSNVQT